MEILLTEMEMQLIQHKVVEMVIMVVMQMEEEEEMSMLPQAQNQ